MSETDCAPNIPDILGCIGRMCRIKKVLVGFPTRRSRGALQKRNVCILARIRRHPHAKKKPYARPSFKTLRQELEAAQFEVEPQYITVVDRDRKYVEVYHRDVLRLHFKLRG